jgi:hypothetical protein
MFSSRKFRDEFAELTTGFFPGAYGSGSSIGSAISMVGTRKLVFHLYGGSGAAASAVLTLFAASVSGGTGSASFGSATVASTMVGSLVSASGGVSLIEVNGTYLENNSIGPWVFPHLSISGAATLNCAVVCHGFLKNYNPASNGELATYVKSEVLLLA